MVKLEMELRNAVSRISALSAAPMLFVTLSPLSPLLDPYSEGEFLIYHPPSTHLFRAFVSEPASHCHSLSLCTGLVEPHSSVVNMVLRLFLECVFFRN